MAVLMAVDYDYGFILCLPDISRPLRPSVDTFHATDRPWHYGIDAYAPVRSKLIAAAAGIVRTAVGSDIGSAGRYVEILHRAPDGWYLTRYLHMLEVFVKSGDVIQQGQLIGTCDTTGNANSSHVHHDIRYWQDETADNWVGHGSKWGTPYDPVLFGILKVPTSMVEITIDRPVLRMEVAPFTVKKAVKELQYMLSLGDFLMMEAGVNYNKETGAYDGKHGESTDEAVRGYQKSKGLVVDGIVGAATWFTLLDY